MGPYDNKYEKKEFVVAGIVVTARKSDGGAFYTVWLPNGEIQRVLAEVFETVAKEVKKP